MAAFGSAANPDHLVLEDAVLNNIKANVGFPYKIRYFMFVRLTCDLFDF